MRTKTDSDASQRIETAIFNLQSLLCYGKISLQLNFSNGDQMKNKNSMVKKWFLPYLRKYRGTVALDLFCAALTTLCELVLPMIARKITDIAVNDPSSLTVSLILELAVLYIALKGVDMLAGYYMTYVGHTMGVKIEKSMREDMFAHLLRLPLDYFSSTKVGQLMSRLTTDMFDVAEFAHHCPEEFFIAAIKIVVSFIILAAINLPLTVLSFAALPFMYFGTMYFRRKMHTAFKDRRVQAGEVNARTETALLGIRVVKSFTREKHEQERFLEESSRLAEIQKCSYRYMARLGCVVRFFDGLMYVIMILVGGLFILNGKITTADYAAYLLYDAMLIAAVKRIVEFTEQFEKGMTGIERFAEIMQVAPEPGCFSGNEEAAASQADGKIEFKNVTFRYDGESREILENINFTVNPGENIAVVGPSGSGKTTLCSLIARFYQLDSGEITLDDKNINDYTLPELRQSIGIVEQDIYLFSGTVMENILYGKSDATKQQVIEAAKKAGADEFIRKLPNGYDTYIGERGTMLSGGQKQRISIARAFLKNPPVLILDEATSALDAESELIVKKSLSALSKGRTTLTVAHRLTTIKNASRIIVLTENGIEQQGTHEQLMSVDGIYKRLYCECE